MGICDAISLQVCKSFFFVEDFTLTEVQWKDYVSLLWPRKALGFRRGSGIVWPGKRDVRNTLLSPLPPLADSV